jgi:hypothetical protein
LLFFLQNYSGTVFEQPDAFHEIAGNCSKIFIFAPPGGDPQGNDQALFE